MIKLTELTSPLDYDEKSLSALAAKELGAAADDIKSIKILKRSVDARKRDREGVRFIFTLALDVHGEKRFLKHKNVTPYIIEETPQIIKKTFQKRPVVVGFGPAGMFSALTLARAGANPIVLERGKSVDERREAVEQFRKSGKLDVECNVQFGEGGAGTFSDGKLTTGTKDIRTKTVFREFYSHGAPEDILVNAKPHIGTDKLRDVVKNIRNEIISLGGEVIFGARFTGCEQKNGKLSAALYEVCGESFRLETDSVILATGHSARDTFYKLYKSGINLSQKPFAVGVRIEHLQSELDMALYGESAGHPSLGAADYKLVAHLPSGRSLYTFCMCPGGYVMAAASEENTVVTNGMSCYARDGKNANSALLTAIEPKDLPSGNPLAGVELQRKIERGAFLAGGGDYSAPISLVGDFLSKKKSVQLGRVTPTYLPSVSFAFPDEYLPDFVAETLREGIPLLGRKIRGFDCADAILTGAETRSSSPIRINRGESGESVSLGGLYPCGEGAGYAGGIVSAAVDGIRIAEMIIAAEKA